MLIPLGTDRPLHRPTLVTYGLIAVNVAVFVAQSVLERATPTGQQIDPLTSKWMLVPPGIWGTGAGVPQFHWWQLFSYAFIHGGLMHLLGNMLFLYVFGPNIEDRVGRIWFLVFYLLGGAAAGGTQIVFAKMPVVGASGAIAACTGAYLVMFPRTQVKTIFLLSLGRIYSVSAWWLITLSLVWDLFSESMAGVGLHPGGPLGTGRDNVAHLAHLGGYAYGMVVALVLLATKLVPREPYDLFTMGKQAYRRRQFKEAGRQAQQKVQQHWDKSVLAQKEADALAAARAEVVGKINMGDLPGAGAAYKRLVENYANFVGGTTLSRRYQYDLANYFYATKDHNAAVYAYERFLEAYPKDADAGHIKLLLGMIHARSLNDPVKAKQLIQESLRELDESGAALAKRELEALG